MGTKKNRLCIRTTSIGLAALTVILGVADMVGLSHRGTKTPLRVALEVTLAFLAIIFGSIGLNGIVLKNRATVKCFSIYILLHLSLSAVFILGFCVCSLVIPRKTCKAFSETKIYCRNTSLTLLVSVTILILAWMLMAYLYFTLNRYQAYLEQEAARNEAKSALPSTA
ncbi:hypothetical protein DSO57_1032463 [Entomophthora muscae]|uniref:Uncharacterized protein n=2 Tax=Entomophthora muscae TaxID=34485 RepID=A0ACC2SC60_9FUNG|nr:hypothetical protein DSO57_1038265 [Entomophthora muscae]KAJ9060284.1 hypothetical protein DSO57_1032463 [Entomophthora muscae]